MSHARPPVTTTTHVLDSKTRRPLCGTARRSFAISRTTAARWTPAERLRLCLACSIKATLTMGAFKRKA